MYSHTQYEILMTPSNGTTTASGDHPFQWGPGMVPHILRGFAVMLASGGGANPLGANSILLQHLSLASGATATTAVTLNGATTDVIGDVIFKQNLNVEIAPGSVFVVNVPAAVASGPAFKASIYVEPRWERPGNLGTIMREST